MYYENHQLAYEFCQLKNSCEFHSMWSYNNTLYIKFPGNEIILKIFHLTNTDKIFGVDNLDGYKINVSF